jgi:ADP-heptose:LPS heptosyltransferase
MKYLLSEAHGIGDCILILPVAKAIKNADPEAEVVVFTSSNKSKIKINEGIMSLQHYVDRIEYYSIGEKLHSLWFLLKNMLHRYDYGIVIQDYDTPNTSMVPSRIVGLCAKKTCGTRITQRPAIKYDYYLDREKGVRRDEYFYRALKLLGLNVEKDETTLLDKDVVETIIPECNLNKSNKTVAIVMGTAPVSLRIDSGVKKNNSKEWPYESWYELSMLLVENQYNVLLMGGGKEKEEVERRHFDFDIPNIHNFIGTLSIDQSIAMLSVTDVVVGADTGLMHCAGALGKPSITLFGCTDHNEYLPFGEYSFYIQSSADCSPCFGTVQSVLCEHKKCMSLISVTEVYNRILEVFESNYGYKETNQ